MQFRQATDITTGIHNAKNLTVAKKVFKISTSVQETAESCGFK